MGRSRNIGSIYAELTLRDATFRKKLNDAGKAAAAFGKKAAVTGTAAFTAGLAASGVALAAGTRKTLDQVDALGDMAAQTGIAVADLMKLQRAYEDGGRAANMAGADIAKMQKNLVTAAGGGKDPFAQLGLSAKDLINLDPAEQFSRIGAAMMGIENPAMRTAAAMEIFGKGGRELLTVFEGLPAAERALGRMPELAQRFAGAMGEANDLMGHLPLKSDQFFMGFTAGIIGQLLPGLQKIDQYDFTNLGENLGQTIAAGFSGITDGIVFEVAALKFEAFLAELDGVMKNYVVENLKSWTPVGQLYNLATEGQFHTLNPIENLQTAAGNDNPNQGFIDEMNASADTLWNHLEQRMKNARMRVENQPADTIAPAMATPTPVPIPQAPAAPAPLPAAPFAAPFATPLPTTSSSDFVNDYQRRGLSLSGSAESGTDGKAQEAINVLREMQRLLARVADSNNPSSW